MRKDQKVGAKVAREEGGKGIRSHICTIDSCRCMQLNCVSRLRGLAFAADARASNGLFWKGERQRDGGWGARFIEMRKKDGNEPQVGYLRWCRSHGSKRSSYQDVSDACQ